MKKEKRCKTNRKAKNNRLGSRPRARDERNGKRSGNRPGPSGQASNKPGSALAMARAWVEALLTLGTRTTGKGEVAAQIAG